MKKIKDIFVLTQKIVGQKHCSLHNQTYNLIKTPAGIVGNCPVCFKKQIKEENQRLASEALKMRDNWQTVYIRRYEKVSDDLINAKISSYKPNHKTQKQAKDMAIRFIKTFDRRKSIIFSGKPGNGKSHLAYAITKALRNQNYKTWFIKTRDLLSLFKNTYKENAQFTEERLFDLIKSVDLLVLDDVGSEYVKLNESSHETWASDILYQILDLRLNKSIVCTTNYTETGLQKKYGYNGERIISRMMENAEAIRLQGEDYRRNNNVDSFVS